MQKLTKSQKRKLNKIEVGVLVRLQSFLILFYVYRTWNDSLSMHYAQEEKEKALLLSKSIETLEYALILVYLTNSFLAESLLSHELYRLFHGYLCWLLFSISGNTKFRMMHMH